MKILNDPDVDKRLSESGLTGQDAVGQVREQTGHYFVLCAQCAIFSGDDKVAEWGSAIARLVEVDAGSMTSTTISCGSPGRVFSSMAIESLDSQTPTSNPPPWMQAGNICFERFSLTPDLRMPIWIWANLGRNFGPGIV